MKTLIFLRHAKSSWKDSSLPDEERPLNKRGKREAPQVGETLRQQNLLPDLILCSTALRARKTVEAVIEKSGYSGQVQYRDDLYQNGAKAYFAALQSLPEETRSVLLVAHNPDMEEALQVLTGVYQPMPTACLAWMELPIDSWKNLKAEKCARLVGTWRPPQEG